MNSIPPTTDILKPRFRTFTVRRSRELALQVETLRAAERTLRAAGEYGACRQLRGMIERLERCHNRLLEV